MASAATSCPGRTPGDRRRSRRDPHPFEVVVSDQPPVVTPGLALALLRLFRRRMDRQPALDENTRPLHPPGQEDAPGRKAS